jgi:hypothetical protein
MQVSTDSRRVLLIKHSSTSPGGQSCEAFSNSNIVFVQPLTAMVDPIRDLFADAHKAPNWADLGLRPRRLSFQTGT